MASTSAVQNIFIQGFHESVEMWEPAALICQRNHPGVAFFHEDIREESLKQRILAIHETSPIDVVIGGPPYQPGESPPCYQEIARQDHFFFLVRNGACFFLRQFKVSFDSYTRSRIT
nr:hypothetical protein [Candidatus Sigynarchaeota archaeon]